MSCESDTCETEVCEPDVCETEVCNGAPPEAPQAQRNIGIVLILAIIIILGALLLRKRGR